MFYVLNITFFLFYFLNIAYISVTLLEIYITGRKIFRQTLSWI